MEALFALVLVAAAILLLICATISSVKALFKLLIGRYVSNITLAANALATLVAFVCIVLSYKI